MHEMSLMANLFSIIQAKAKEVDARKILSVRIRVGALSGVEPDLLESAFEVFSAGTSAEGASFEVEKVPFKVRCRNCGEEEIERQDFMWVCPKCMSTDLDVSSGDDLIVERMEVEVDD